MALSPPRPAPKPLQKRQYAAGDLVASKYELKQLLGKGGMGEVWEALNVRLDSSVAIKLVRVELEEQSVRDRLLQEARAAAKLEHPSIVRVFDVGETDGGAPFIVMELLKGESFGEVLERRGKLPATVCVQTLLPIVDALSAAHKHNIVHRDLKPDNIFLAESGEHTLSPKLVDFGVVKFQQPGAESKLTQMGTVVGSPGYMSPEQARGLDDVDQRTDVWAFSVVLYEALSGRMPFEGNNYNALLRAIVEDAPNPLEECVSVDLALADIVSRGLRKDRLERIQSMDELGRALATWLLSQGTHQDVSGNGVEARWLLRDNGAARLTLDSLASSVSRSGPPRASSPSPNGFAVSPEGGTSNGDFALAPTSISATPAPSELEAEPSRPKNRRWFWVSAGLSLAGIGVATWLLILGASDAEVATVSGDRKSDSVQHALTPSSLKKPGGSAVQPQASPEPAREVPTAPPTAMAPTMRPSAESSNPSRRKKPVVKSRRPRVVPATDPAPVPEPAPAQTTAPETKKPSPKRPELDLKSPY